MKKEINLKIIVLIIMTIMMAFSLVLSNKDIKNDKKIDTPLKDTIKYKGKTYVLLEYNMDILTYNFNSNEYYEEDKIIPVSNDKWDVVYFNGDLFVLENQVDEATNYYADDSNYEWYIVFDKDDKEIMFPISLNEEEIKYLYNIENISKDKTIKFDDIKQFASIVKISKDDFIQALTVLVYCDESWYWKTEIMNDYDEEYVIELPKSINEKIIYENEKMNM